MPGASPIQTSFNGGELSPLMYGRVDFDRYRSSLATCLNWIPLVQGPLTRRPGTYFCDEVKDSTKATRLVAFKYSTTQAYVLEFGDLYIRFKKNGGPITLTGQTITGITQANPAVVTYSGSDTYANGDQVDISGVVGMVEVNNRRFTVANVNAGANTFELKTVAGTNVNSTSYTAYSSGGTVEEVYTLTSPYVEADLFELKFVQSADTLYIFHPDYAPRTLVRASDTSWTLAVITFLDGPYLPLNTTATTLTPSAFAPGTGVTLTASATTGINDDQGFLSTDVGRYIRIRQGSVWGYVLITGWTSTTVVTVTVINTLTSTAAKTDWRMGVYSDTTGYPSCGTFFGDRLCMGGVPDFPARIDLSKVGDYENMASSDTTGTVADDNAASFTLNSDDVQNIRWMRGTANGIAIGTFEGEWLVSPSALGEAITPTNINAKQSTANGSTLAAPMRVGNSVLHVAAGGRELYELVYSYENNAFDAFDMTVLAEHVGKGDPDASSGIKELAYQRKRTKVVWAVRNDGMLLGFSYSRADKVSGWHRHELGGYSDSGQTVAAKAESVAVIPSSDGLRDEVWLVVQRYVNGRAVRHVEYMTRLWERGDAQEDAFFVDGGLTYDGAATSTIRGLYHLAGETVSVLADGAAHPDVTISSLGVATLNYTASVVQIGYPYNSDGQALRPEAGAAQGTAQGKIMRSHRVFFRLHDTLGLAVGASFNTSGYGKLTALNFRTSGHAMDAAVPLFSGDKGDFSWEGSYTTENYVCWRVSQPFPATILAIMPDLDTQER